MSAAYLARKLAQLIVTLYAIVTFNFLLFHVLPGSPVKLLARSGHFTPAEVAQTRKLYGLDHALPYQYGKYLWDLVHGQLGISYEYRTPVGHLLGPYLANTVLLLAAATLITIVGGTLVGVYAAARRDRAADSFAVVTSLIGWSLPTFWIAIVLVFILGVWVHGFPLAGISTPDAIYSSGFQHAEDVAWHLFLPSVTLVVVNVAQFVLIARSAVINVVSEDFVLTARAKGLYPSTVMWRHVVRNAMLPVVTTSALAVSFIVGGAIEVETVFSWPGVGLLTYDAVLSRDYPLLEATFLIFSVVVLVVNLLTDLTYHLLDPRIREA